MDEWLKNAPALLYGNNTWLVVNKWCEPLSWTEDANEAAWIMRCVLEREQTMKPREEKPATESATRSQTKPDFGTSNTATRSPNSAHQKLVVMSPSV